MQTIVLKRFNLSLFKNLIEQNLMVDNSIRIRFTKESIKSVALTSSQSFVKLWSVPTNTFIAESEDPVLDFDDDFGQAVPEFEDFDMYVLKGDIFKRLLSVFNEEPVDFEIKIDEDSIANELIITGQTKTTPIRCSFNLSSSELMGERRDYSQIENFLNPKESCKSFILLKDEIDEIKKLIHTLHKTNVQNTSYITISVDVEKGIIRANDKAFNVKYPLVKGENSENIPTESLEFRILKSDFIVSGKHSFEFFYDDSDKKIIMKTSYKHGISICCGTTSTEIVKQQEDSIDSTDFGIDGLEELSSEYFGDDI